MVQGLQPLTLAFLKYSVVVRLFVVLCYTQTLLNCNSKLQSHFKWGWEELSKNVVYSTRTIKKKKNKNKRFFVALKIATVWWLKY